MVTMSVGTGGGGGSGSGDGSGLTPSPPNSSLVVLVVEGSAVNGAYMNEMKTNYIIPALEYFHGGPLEDSSPGAANPSSMGGGLWETNALYGCVIAGSADWLPAPPVSALGPFVHPQQLINALDSIPLVGGRGESHACLAEGLHTAAACLEELASIRTSNDSNDHNNVTRYVILACSNPPYMSVAGGCTVIGGPTGGADDAAAMLGSAGARLSIIAPRKIPALLRLFECAGGDLSQAQARNYAKDPRHLVLVRGFALKERPPSPAVAVPPVAQPSAVPVTAPVSTVVQPVVTEDVTNAQPQMYRPPGPQPPMQTGLLVGSRGRGAGPGSVGGPSISGGPAGQTGAVVSGQVGTTQGPTQVGPGQVGPSVSIGQQPGQMRWLNPTQAAGQRATAPQAPFQHPAPSALLTQLAQPPYPQARPVQPQQNTSQPMVTGAQSMGGPAPPTVPVAGATIPAPNVPPGVAVAVQSGSQQQVVTAATPQRSFIWQGVLEWIEKGKGPSDQQKLKRHLPCQVSASSREFEPELRADTWPPKLIMQLMPKQLIGTIGGHHLKDSKSVLFHPQQNEALESLTKVMGGGYAGCVHFPQSTIPCDIKVLILLYAAEKKTYLGFIPNNQVTFVDRLRKVIEQSKLSQIMSKQQGVGAPGASGMQGAVQGVQGVQVQGVQGVQAVQQGMQNVQASQGNSGGGQQRPLDHLEAARQQNLEKIMQLQQTLEAAQQQEAQFKTQLELEAQYKTQMELVMSSQSHMHQQHQQQAEMMQLDQHYKQVEDARKQLSQLQQMSGGGVGSLAGSGGGMGGAGVGVRLPGGPMQSNLGMGPGGTTMGGPSMGGPGMGPGVSAMGPGSMGPVGPGAGMAVGPGAGMVPGGPPLGPPQSHMMAAQQQQGPGARMMRPGLGGNPGLRHLLQQQVRGRGRPNVLRQGPQVGP